MIRRAYLRVSSDEQQRSQTIETQRREIERYCSAQKLDLDGTYEDNGISGTVAMEHRPAGRQLLEDARNGRLHELLAFKLDRIGRDPASLLAALAELRKLGVRVSSITQPAADDANGRLMEVILSGFSGFERDTIIERSVAGSRRLAEKGTWLGGQTPFGLGKAGVDREARLVVADDEAAIVRKVFTMAASGDSCQKIADLFNQTKVPVPRCHLGKKSRWTRHRVRNILINVVYKGVLAYGKRKTVHTEEGKRILKAVPKEKWILARCPAIVDAELWEQANVALHRNQLAQMVHAKHEYLLSGLVRCGLCQRSYIGCGPRYRCNGRHGALALHGSRDEKCAGKTVRRRELEAAIWDDILGFLKRPGDVLDGLRRKMVNEERGAVTIQEIRRLENQLAASDGAEMRNVAAFTEGLFTSQQFIAERDRLAQRKAELEAALAERRKTFSDALANASFLKTTASLLGTLNAKVGTNLTFELRRKIVQTLVDHVRVETVQGKPKVTVTYRFDPDFDRGVNANRAHAKRAAHKDTGPRASLSRVQDTTLLV